MHVNWFLIPGLKLQVGFLEWATSAFPYKTAQFIDSFSLSQSVERRVAKLRSDMARAPPIEKYHCTISSGVTYYLRHHLFDVCCWIVSVVMHGWICDINP